MNGSNFGRIPALLIWSNMWKRSSRILAKTIQLILYRHLSSGASPQAITSTLADTGTHTRCRFATQVAPCDPRDGGRPDRSCLDNQRIVVLPRLGSIPGSAARNRAPVSKLG